MDCVENLSERECTKYSALHGARSRTASTSRCLYMVVDLALRCVGTRDWMARTDYFQTLVYSHRPPVSVQQIVRILWT